MVGFGGGLTTLIVALLCALTQIAAAEAVQMARGPQNHLLVPAQLNGRPADLLLDTGSEINFLQSDRAEAFRVQITGGELRSARRAFPAAVANDLRIGALSFRRTELALFNLVQFRGPVPGRTGKAADGIIGLNFLRRHGAIINCRTQQLFFAGAGSRATDLAATTRALGFRRIPLQPTTRGFITVPCTIGGKSGALAVDTGAFVTVFDKGTTAALQLDAAESNLTARTAGGRVRALELARIEHFRIGGVPIAPQRFALMDMFPKKKPLRAFTGMGRLEAYDPRVLRARPELWGLLGAELLYHHHAIIDLDSMALYLK